MRLFGRQIKGVNRNTTHHQRRAASSAALVSEIRQVHELSSRFLSALDLDSIARELFDAAMEVVGVDAITFRLRDELTGDFDPIACHRLDLDEWRKVVPRNGSGLSQTVIEFKRAVTLCNPQDHGNAKNSDFLKKYGLVYYLGTPLLGRDRVIGVVGYYSKNTTGFNDKDGEYLVLLANLTAFAVGNIRHSASALEDTGQRAPLHSSSGTSAPAKEEFLNVMSHEFRTPLSLIMGHAGMMREGLLGQINDEQRTSLDRIMENSDNLLAMALSISFSSAHRVQARDAVMSSRHCCLGAARRWFSM